MIHKDALGRDIEPGALVAWSPSSDYAGFRFGRVRGVSPQTVRVERYWELDKAIEGLPGRRSSSSVNPQNLIVIDQLVSNA